MTRQNATQTKSQTPTTSPLSKGGILQRKCADCGNHTVAGGECESCGKQKMGLQRKLTIGASNDPLELEADRIADQVMAAPTHSIVGDTPPHIQRFTEQPTGNTDMAAPDSVGRALSSPGRPLDPMLQQDMEQRFGHDFSRVRVHTDAAAERSAQDVNANAYTVGQDIVFGAGRFAPGTNAGKRLITHELTHVIQQQQMGSLEVQRDELSEEEKRKAIQAKTQCESNLCHPSRRNDSFNGSSLFADSPNLEALRQFATASQKPPESPSSVEKKPEKGAHSSPPGLQPKPVSKKDSLTQGLEDLQNAQRNLGKPKSDQPRAFDRSPIMSSQEMAQLALAMQAANQRAELEAKQKLTLADGTVISLASPPPEKKLTIPPPKPGEFTRDITFEGSVLAKANVEGERARIIHNLDVELKRIEGITEICRGSAQQFLEQWPIMRRLADLTAGAEPPSMSIWFNVDALIKQSQEAIKQGDLEKAIQRQEQANKALRNAQATWYRYKESNIGGAESIKTGAEYTRDGAKYSLMALATVASGGTALAVVTVASVAIDVTEAITKAALGEKVDWGQVAVDVAIQIVLAKFGGKLSSGLMGALQKNPATQKVETQVLRGIVHSLINGVESRTISTYIRALYQNAFTQNKPITWSEFIDQLVIQITDPKSIVMDIILGAVAAKARTKAVGDAGVPSKKPPQLTEGEKPITPPAHQPTEGVTIKAAEGSGKEPSELPTRLINARKRQAMREYEALKPIETLDPNFETTLLNEPEAIRKQIKATKADIASKVDKVAQLRQERDVLVEAKQSRSLTDSEAAHLDKLNQQVTEFESQQRHLDTLEKIPLHDKRTIEGFSSAMKVANQAVRTPRKITELLAEVEREALKLQQQSPNPQERDLAAKGKPSNTYLEQASKKIAIESGLPEPFDLTTEHGKFDDNSAFVQGVVKQGKPFVDKQFNPGEPHGQNVHLLQLILVQRAFKQSGLRMTVPQFMEHLSSTPKSEEVWKSVFDTTQEGAINKPEQFTDVYRKAFGRSRE
jgi:hypothetical protein